jgi:hypothetical protein
MNRRGFCALAGATAASLAAGPAAALLPKQSERKPPGRDLTRHRFGVNYTPSRDWWFCWNDWHPEAMQRDLDGIAGLGADHLRILLIWPYFQPNPRWVSPLLLDRLDQLLTWMGARGLDAVVTVFTGQLSGWFFLPPFNKAGAGFYTDSEMWAAQEVFVRALGQRMGVHPNFLGFDIGNEINTCWRCEPAQGDRWMARMFAVMESVAPGGLHVNGVDELPWMEVTTFSPQALAARPMPTMHCYPYWSGALKYGGPMNPPSTKILAAMAALIRAYAGETRKPVWAEEFNTCIEALNEKGQAAWLETAVTAAIAEGVSWFTYWDSHDVDRRFAFNPVEYSLGLMTNDGRVKEQGRVFQRLANAYRGKEVVFPARALPEPPRERTLDTSWRWMLDWMGWKARGAT